MSINSLRELVQVNDNFKNAINLFLNLNKTDKILSYIPTKSSVNILKEYIENVLNNKEHASLLIGPYGKGKSLLLLILLAILSLERNQENTKIMNQVIERVENVDKYVSNKINEIWNKKRLLPVIISNSYSDLNQAFLIGINDALKRENLKDLVPDTYFSAAVQVINNWENNYQETFKKFKEKLKEKDVFYKNIISNLKAYNKEALDIFKEIYPQLTSGSNFNPMVNTDILPLYKSINEKLCEEYEYSGMYIIFDEFSKFIESRNNESVGIEMKMIQDMCELADDTKENAQMFITLVTHKSIKEYGNYLSQNIINSFLGIEGRITEKYFITSSKNNYELIQNAIIKKENYLECEKVKDYFNNDYGSKCFRIPAFNTIFDYNSFKKIIWEGCYPLNPISAYLLLNISEKVAQNERTLFTFISKDESKSMARYINNHEEEQEWIIDVHMIYDYFKNIFKKDVSNVYVHEEWLKAEYAISKVKEVSEKNVLKCIALINIVNKFEELPAIKEVINLACRIENIDEVINSLISKDLIYLKTSTNCYQFKTKANSTLKKEIDRRRKLQGISFSINNILEEVSDKKFEIPKQYNQDMCMTRYFKYEFIDYNTFISIENADTFFDERSFCDGKIIMIVCKKEDRFDEEEIKNKLNHYKEQRLVIVKPGIPFKLLNQIEVYQILQNIKKDKFFIQENKVLIKEIKILEEEISNVLINYINKAYSLQDNAKAYYYDGYNTKICVQNSINRLISLICTNVFNRTPIINNELINRECINTSPIKKARKSIIDYNLSQKNDEDFYSGTNAEATIYRCVFVRTNVISDNADSGIKMMLDEIKEFIYSCSDKKMPLSLLIDKLTKAPYGMRRGVIPLYLSYMLSTKIEDAVVYFGNKEVMINSDIIVNMCEQPKDYSLLITSKTVEKDKYIAQLMEAFDVEGNYNLSGSKLNNIIISMQRWFRSLPQFTRNFRSNVYVDLDEKMFKALILFKKLLQKIDTNPYEILYVKLPQVCSESFNLLDTAKAIIKMKNVLEKYMYDVTINVENNIISIFRNNSNQDLDLHHILKEWLNVQSDMAKIGILGNVENEFVNYIQEMNTYDDIDITNNIVRIVSNNYIENWNDHSFDLFKKDLVNIKKKIENINDDKEVENKKVISFINSNGEKITRYYENREDTNDNSGNIMKNIFEDTLEDFEDLDVNEKINILVQMIEKVLTK